jgi:hypothetical protein
VAIRRLARPLRSRDHDRVAGAASTKVGYVPLARSAKGSASDASGDTLLHVCCTSPKFIKTLVSEVSEVALRVDFRALIVVRIFLWRKMEPAISGPDPRVGCTAMTEPAFV